ncbi:MAG: hypothetical protein A2029_00120 [Chloroflexi bacterium RBG_19FT_COMBO_47_9]|nr:MAG: hypothetical protein A2029_00120 [Chloroflexi bacterium RBG_19FT_COMBO_47_9]
MKFNPTRFAVVDTEGNLKFPHEIKDVIYLTPEVILRIETGENEVQIQPSSDHLARVYLEPTNRCNLECRTCIRNVWDEPLGMMEWEIYEQILDGIHAFTPMPTVFLGGFGEPLIHPKIIEMIRGVKESGGSVELITNGILLTEDVSAQLIEIGLDIL